MEREQALLPFQTQAYYNDDDNNCFYGVDSHSNQMFEQATYGFLP